MPIVSDDPDGQTRTSDVLDILIDYHRSHRSREA